MPSCLHAFNAMPEYHRAPITVYEVTKKAVEQLRDSDDDYGSYDEALRDLLLQADSNFGFLDDEVKEALDAGRQTLTPDSEELTDE